MGDGSRTFEGEHQDYPEGDAGGGGNLPLHVVKAIMSSGRSSLMDPENRYTGEVGSMLRSGSQIVPLPSPELRQQFFQTLYAVKFTEAFPLEQMDKIGYSMERASSLRDWVINHNLISGKLTGKKYFDELPDFSPEMMTYSGFRNRLPDMTHDTGIAPMVDAFFAYALERRRASMAEKGIN